MRKFWYKLTDGGGFAVGVLVGALAVIFFLAVSATSPSAPRDTTNGITYPRLASNKAPISKTLQLVLDNKPDQPTKFESDSQHYESEENKTQDWLYWPMRLITLEDTIAQWLMMIFSLGALIALLKTLKTTREVGEAQTRAYLSLSIDDITISHKAGGKVKVSIRSNIVNSGNSPAYNVRVGYNICYVQSGEVTDAIFDIDRIGHVGNPHPVVPPKNTDQGTTMSKVVDRVSDAIIRLIYMVEFTDVFGKINYTPIFSGTLVEHPESGGEFVFAMDSVSVKNPAQQ